MASVSGVFYFSFVAAGRMLFVMPNGLSDFCPDTLVVQGCQSRVAAHVPLAKPVVENMTGMVIGV